MTPIRVVALSVASTVACLFVYSEIVKNEIRESRDLVYSSALSNIDAKVGTLNSRIVGVSERANYLYAEMLERTTPSKCKRENFALDVVAGTIGGVSVNSSRRDIEEKFPCFTYSGDSEDSVNYGGGVFYLDHGVMFYLKAKAITVDNAFIAEPYGYHRFRGALSFEDPGMQRHFFGIKKKKPDIENQLKNLELLSEYQNGASEGTTSINVYKTSYGCLVFEFRGNDVNSVSMLGNTCTEEAARKNFIR